MESVGVHERSFRFSQRMARVLIVTLTMASTTNVRLRKRQKVNYGAIDALSGLELSGETQVQPAPKIKNPIWKSRINQKWIDGTGVVRVVDSLTLDFIQREGFNEPIMVPNGAARLTHPKEYYNIDNIAALIGEKEDAPVLDVLSQREVVPKWSVRDWVKYFKTPHEARTRVLNIISLEFSHTSLAQHVRAPEVVEQLDWIETVWPSDARTYERKGKNVKVTYPKVQYYCLSSTQGCYTDFHIDFGGSSVWYHVLQGQKVFWLIAPTDVNLKQYEKWSNSPEQESTFFADMVHQDWADNKPASHYQNTVNDRCHRVVVNAGNTFFIPAGWIHAVYTPEDSIVFGGNFLHDCGIETQLKVYRIENVTHVEPKFKYPLFEFITWMAALKFLARIRRGEELRKVERDAVIALADWLPWYKAFLPLRDTFNLENNPINPEWAIDCLKAYLRDEPLPDLATHQHVQQPLSDVLLCVCRARLEDQTDDGRFWIGCSKCGEWFHGDCMQITQAEADALDDWYCPKCSDNKHTSPGAGQKRKIMQRTEPSDGESDVHSVNQVTKTPQPTVPVTTQPPSFDHVIEKNSVKDTTPAVTSASILNSVTLPPLSYPSFAPSMMSYPVQYADKYLQSHVPVTPALYPNLPSVPYYHNYPPQYSTYSNGL